MFVVFNGIPDLLSKGYDFLVCNTENLEIKKLSYDELVQEINKFGASAFSDNVIGDNGDYSVGYRVNVRDLNITALNWTLNFGQVMYKDSDVSLEVDDELNLVFKINGESYTLACKPQANEGVPKVHWNDCNNKFDRIKEYNKAEILEIDYVEAVSDGIVKFFLHYDDNRIVVAIDESGTLLGLLSSEYDFDKIYIHDNRLDGYIAEMALLKKKDWLTKFRNKTIK